MWMTCGFFHYHLKDVSVKTYPMVVLSGSVAVGIIHLCTRFFARVHGSSLSDTLWCLGISDMGRVAQLSHDLLLPAIPTGEAVFARCLSSLKEERVQASKLLQGPKVTRFSGNKEAFLEDIRRVSPCAGSEQVWGAVDPGEELLCSCFTRTGSCCQHCALSPDVHKAQCDHS